MHLNRRHFMVAGAASLGSGTAALADERYPSKPIRMVAPFAPGSSDAIARKLGEHVARSIGQSIVIETRPGAQGTVGSRAVAKSKADGYTLLQGSNSTHSAAPFMFKDPGYDPLKDFTPIARWTINPLALVVPAELPVRSVEDFMRHARARSGKLSYGVGNTAGLLTVQMLKQQIGFEAEPIQYPGTSQAVIDFAAGRLDFMVTDPMIVDPYVKAGKLRMLGLTSRQRLSTLPDVAPLAELGLPQYEYASWIGLFGPAGMPEEATRMLHDAYNKALADAEIEKFLADQGTITARASREEFAVFLQDQLKTWQRLIKDSGLQPQ